MRAWYTSVFLQLEWQMGLINLIWQNSRTPDLRRNLGERPGGRTAAAAGWRSGRPAGSPRSEALWWCGWSSWRSRSRLCRRSRWGDPAKREKSAVIVWIAERERQNMKRLHASLGWFSHLLKPHLLQISNWDDVTLNWPLPCIYWGEGSEVWRRQRGLWKWTLCAKYAAVSKC